MELLKPELHVLNRGPLGMPDLLIFGLNAVVVSKQFGLIEVSGKGEVPIGNLIRLQQFQRVFKQVRIVSLELEPPIMLK